MLRQNFHQTTKELSILFDCDTHTNIARYLCATHDDTLEYIVYEWFDNTLQEYIENQQFRQRCMITHACLLEQITHGLAHLHEIKIGENIVTN
jgi:serine/threonine protein kinase